MTQLFSATFNTKLGEMIAMADEKSLFLLEFCNRKNIDKEILKLKNKYSITSGITPPLTNIQKEINEYFSGKLKKFSTPFSLLGTPFQNKVWSSLLSIPYGKTLSYGEFTNNISTPTAIRAVATAIGSNQLCILLPCHRVINKNGKLGGYSGGLERKEWLLKFER